MVTDTAKKIIDGIIKAEGGYVNDPADRGGATNYGITEKVARDYGYRGHMRDLPREAAFDIYLQQYYTAPGFDKIAQRDTALADEMTDCGVNMGPRTATVFLQRVLNVFNLQGDYWVDISTDGAIGPRTLAALDAYYKRRPGGEGRKVLVAAVDHLQGARYVELAESRPANQKFVYGWIRERTNIGA